MSAPTAMLFAELPDGRGGLFRVSQVDVRDRDGVDSLFGEEERRGPAEADLAAGAGDERHFPLESQIHICLLNYFVGS